jgi:hypothetical protein
VGKARSHTRQLEDPWYAVTLAPAANEPAAARRALPRAGSGLNRPGFDETFSPAGLFYLPALEAAPRDMPRGTTVNCTARVLADDDLSLCR